MSANSWLIVAIAGFSLAGIAFVISIFMFFKMNILSVIGDLSGKSVAREIKAMRKFDKTREHRSYQADHQMPRQPDESRPSKEVDAQKPTPVGTAFLPPKQEMYEPQTLYGEEPTEQLSDSITEKLELDSSDLTCELEPKGEPQVSILQQSSGTTILHENEQQETLVKQEPVPFRVVRSIVVTFGDEDISKAL